MTDEEYEWLNEEGKRLGNMYINQDLPYDEFMKQNASPKYYRLLAEEKARVEDLMEKGIQV